MAKNKELANNLKAKRNTSVPDDNNAFTNMEKRPLDYHPSDFIVVDDFKNLKEVHSPEKIKGKDLHRRKMARRFKKLINYMKARNCAENIE